MKVGDVDIYAEHRAMAPVLDAEPRESLKRRYVPRSIAVRYARRTGQNWRAPYISLYGPQIRQDGTIGTREVHEQLWTRQGTGYKPIPEWAQRFYDENFPAGGPTDTTTRGCAP